MANQTKRTESPENWFNNPNWSNWNWNNWANWNNMNNPLPNLDKVRQEASKNMEAMSAANQAALEGLQAISKKTAEIMQQTARQSLECAKENSNSKDPSEVQARNADYFNNLMQSYCSNAREMAEIASKSALQVVEICNGRMTEATKEFCSNCK